MRDSLAQADLLLLSGGLGPTEDDVTRDAVAELVGRKLIYRLDAEEQIIARFRRSTGRWQRSTSARLS